MADNKSVTSSNYSGGSQSVGIAIKQTVEKVSIQPTTDYANMMKSSEEFKRRKQENRAERAKREEQEASKKP
jgi:hypothetical protein